MAGFVATLLSVTVLVDCDRASAREPGAAARGSGWRTVVIPAAIATRDPGWTARIITGSIPPDHAPAGSMPLLGVAHMLDGIASFYWQEQLTASGERFDKAALTAAHRTLPIGTRVQVTHVASGRSVVVRINDRGPFKPGRVIDLSLAAAATLGMTASGLARVRLDVVR